MLIWSLYKFASTVKVDVFQYCFLSGAGPPLGAHFSLSTPRVYASHMSLPSGSKSPRDSCAVYCIFSFHAPNAAFFPFPVTAFFLTLPDLAVVARVPVARLS